MEENDPDAKQIPEAAAALASWGAQVESGQQATEPSAPGQVDLPATEINLQAPDTAALDEVLDLAQPAQALEAEDNEDDEEDPFAALDALGALVSAETNKPAQGLDQAFDPTEDNFFAAGSNAQEILSDPFAANDAVLHQAAMDDPRNEINSGDLVQKSSQDLSDEAAGPASLVPKPESQDQAQAPEGLASDPEKASSLAAFTPKSTERVEATDRIRPARHHRPSKVGAVIAVVLGAIVGVAVIFALQMRTSPPQIDRDLAAANQLVKSGRAAEAVTLYHDILRRDPNHLSAQRNLGVALALTGQQAKADASLRDYLQGAQDSQDTQLVRDYLGE